MLSLPQAEVEAEVPLAVQEQEILPQLPHPKELAGAAGSCAPGGNKGSGGGGGATVAGGSGSLMATVNGGAGGTGAGTGINPSPTAWNSRSKCAFKIFRLEVEAVRQDQVLIQVV